MVNERVYYYKEGEYRKNRIAVWFLEELIEYGLTTDMNEVNTLLAKGKINESFERFRQLSEKCFTMSTSSTMFYLYEENYSKFGNSVILDMYNRVCKTSFSFSDIRIKNVESDALIKKVVNPEDLIKKRYGYTPTGERRVADIRYYKGIKDGKPFLYSRYTDIENGQFLKRKKEE